MTEEQLAGEQNQALQARLFTSRRKYVTLTVLFLAAGIPFAATGFWMIALSALIAAGICVSQYIDANSQLHEIRRRPTRSLIPNFSMLRPASRGTVSSEQDDRDPSVPNP